ncbi:Cytochrome b5 isoform A [Galdieria sulphuraria]|uniref:Cytochrome b5 n=1 Tax=Galdieria sulphuraria TaxID=130081 RepID=M2Y5H8_GALSU|nr:cytochrome b5 [Galdieria sulphuraria]EME31109.1 cytochrome b5 [Galdieria sulphuraria]GJD12421.1 Cytochrome b5 isoform A [Galdieria sulphuraria]|eukprot:XP_005707629.1 cytochrome b5 [Galdieria sulphuraria]
MKDNTHIYTIEQIARHHTRKDLWVIVHGKVYNLSSFLDTHPGGDEILLQYAGDDGTLEFEKAGHPEEAQQLLQNYCIGYVTRDCVLECDGLLKQTAETSIWRKYLRTLAASTLDSFHWLLLLVGIISVLLLLFHF